MSPGVIAFLYRHGYVPCVELPFIESIAAPKIT
jgi:hypothetical protein